MHIYDILFEHMVKSINYLKKLISSLAKLSRKICEGKKPNSESATSMVITRTISSHETSYLARATACKCSVLPDFVQSVQEASVRACS